MNTKGFTHLVALVTITVIAIAMIGVMAWFRMETNQQASNTSTVINSATDDLTISSVQEAIERAIEVGTACSSGSDSILGGELTPEGDLSFYDIPAGTWRVRCLGDDIIYRYYITPGGAVYDGYKLRNDVENALIEAGASITATTDWQQYKFDYQTNTFYKESDDGTRTTIKTPFALDGYYVSTTPYGALFWKKGPQRTHTAVQDIGEFSYEYGVEPDFRRYDYESQTFVALPALNLALGETKFEKVYHVHFSSTEPKMVVEIGEYDTASSQFEPGLIESQPVKTHGVVIDFSTNTIVSGDPLRTFLDALDLATTAWHGMYWDSSRQVAAAVPGGEGCGPYNNITFVKLDTRAATKIGGENSLTFAEDLCNPRNGVSPDGKWFVLYGKSDAGNLDVYLFSTANYPVPVKSKLGITFPGNDFLSAWSQTWDISNEFPIITFSNGVSVNFNN